MSNASTPRRTGAYDVVRINSQRTGAYDAVRITRKDGAK